jgi:hypothetical protein
MTIMIQTETGSIYALSKESMKVSRLSSELMRRDGEWLKMYEWPDITIGQPLKLALEPLGEGNRTFRITSPVVKILKEDE